MISTALAVCLVLAPGTPADPPGRLDLDGDELKPGLVGEYRSLAAADAKHFQIDPKPAFYLGRSSPHPRIPPGPFEVTWSGVISIRDPGTISFSAFVGGEVTVTVDGISVLDGRGLTDVIRIVGKAQLKRDPGYYSLSLRFRSLPDVPARLQLWWEGESFAREPIPAWRLGHLVRDRSEPLERHVLAARGRLAAGQHGCARCHRSAFPSVNDPSPGPSLAEVSRRLGKAWLMQWLAAPEKAHPAARMPRLFPDDRTGFVERWIVTESLTAGRGKKSDEAVVGDHRRGRITFLSVGCAACHLVPDVDSAEQKALDRIPFAGLADRMSAADLVAFLGNPHSRYPDGRMPRLPVTPGEARDVAAYLLLWSKPAEVVAEEPPKPQELQDLFRRLGVRDQAGAATILLRDKGCTACHTGLGESRPRDVPIKDPTAPGCRGDKTGVRYSFPRGTRGDLGIAEYVVEAGREKYLAPFADRQHRLAQSGCVRCHQRDSDRPPPIEEIGSTLGGAHLQELPFLRTPRLTNPHQKFLRSYLASTVREGVSGLRWSRFSYRMPGFGLQAETLLQALTEADGELPSELDPPPVAIADPTVGTLHGARLVGFQGYGCASCHVWAGKLLASPDPGATGPDLTRTVERLRRDWFDRYLESPLRFHPGTPMPGVFPHGKSAMLTTVLAGDPVQQKDALWAYLAQGKNAPGPAPPPPLPITPPMPGEAILVAQIPIRLADGRVVESICLLSADNDLVIYDLAEGAPHTLLTGGQILRNVQGRIRQFLSGGTPVDLAAPGPLQLVIRGKSEVPQGRSLSGYDRLADGVRITWELRFTAGSVAVVETIRIVRERNEGRLIRELTFRGVPQGGLLELRTKVPSGWKVTASVSVGEGKTSTVEDVFTVTASSNTGGNATVAFEYGLPPARAAPAWENKPLHFADIAEGALERPGFRAIAYPRPKTVSGEDRIMPAAIAVRPRDGQLFVASLKTGELFALRDPNGDGKQAHFENYGRGLYQDALSMRAEDDGLYVLHRRNLTKILETGKDKEADRFERIAALPHGIADTYDMAYGLTRDREGRFVFSYAPYANATLPGSGGVLRLRPGRPPDEVAFGMRNPLGWCAGPDGEIFFTDNQGDWVATNKLCHVSEGKFYGFPNPAQRQHVSKPPGKPTVWVPYGWARSINGVAFDNTGGKFGPFAGQFFMAELMFGGAIIRADVEKVNGVYQGACFPFWGKGLLGPVSLAFDPRGHLYVGGITEPGWMAQPDRGALFRLDFTGETPFEMQSIHARPRGFRIVFTRPVAPAGAARVQAYRLESYRYEYTGAYGSPELDRTTVKVEKAEVSADGLSVELTTGPLVKDRVYLLTLDTPIRSATGKPLVHATGAYTLNEIPAK